MIQPQNILKLINFPQKAIILSFQLGEIIYQKRSIINCMHNLAFWIYRQDLELLLFKKL